MRRLALLLATSVLGTGCIVHDDRNNLNNPPCFASTITVRWPSFLLAKPEKRVLQAIAEAETTGEDVDTAIMAAANA